MLKLGIAEIFGNNMVLQQGVSVEIWGTGEPDTEVVIRIQDFECAVRVDKQGKWRTAISPLHVDRKIQLSVSDKSENIILENISVGEVFIAGGQSNMEFYMRYDKDFDIEVKNCKNEDIRFFDYPVYSTEKVRQVKDFSLFGYWRPCDEENLQYYSAVAYYFAKNLQKALDVPIGIIGCNCGGTRCCCWMDESYVEKYGELWLDDYTEGLKKIKDYKAQEEAYLNNSFTDKSRPFDNPMVDRMMYGIPKDELEMIFRNMGESGGNIIGPWHEWRPGGLYHTMVQKIAPFTVRGVIWYQGESDEDHPEIFASMIEGLVTCWRQEFKANLPFLMVQLAPFGEVIGNGGKYYPYLREQQKKAADSLDKIYLISSSDVGSDYDIHPKEKEPIGERLALMARGRIYNENLLCAAPEFMSVERKKSKVMIRLSNSQGLYISGDKVNALRIFVCDTEQELGADEYTVSVVSDGIQISLSEKMNGKKLKVYFAKDPFYKVNLYNAAHIPAMPFKVEI